MRICVRRVFLTTTKYIKVTLLRFASESHTVFLPFFLFFSIKLRMHLALSCISLFDIIMYISSPRVRMIASSYSVPLTGETYDRACILQL